MAVNSSNSQDKTTPICIKSVKHKINDVSIPLFQFGKAHEPKILEDLPAFHRVVDDVDEWPLAWPVERPETERKDTQ